MTAWVGLSFIGPPVTKNRWMCHAWYGPDHGWGTTFASVDEGKRFPSRRAVEAAARSVWGRDWPRHVIALRLVDAEQLATIQRDGGDLKPFLVFRVTGRPRPIGVKLPEVVAS